MLHEPNITTWSLPVRKKKKMLGVCRNSMNIIENNSKRKLKETTTVLFRSNNREKNFLRTNSKYKNRSKTVREKCKKNSKKSKLVLLFT